MGATLPLESVSTEQAKGEGAREESGCRQMAQITKMKAALLPISKITIPDFVERPFAKVQDARDADSIRKHGIQQPLVVVEDGDRLLLAKGLRRLRIARALGLTKVPVVIERALRGYDAETYVRELRLALDMHRQDLLPSQKAALLEELKRRFGMNHKQLSAYLGIDADSVTNWLAVRHYIAPVVAALDSGHLTMQGARVFDGMTEEGQQTLWQRHGQQLQEAPRGTLHGDLRRRYDPGKHPTFYRAPQQIAERLSRKGGARKSKLRPTLTAEEKRRLSSSLELKEIELREAQEEERRLKAQIQASIVPIAGILRNEKLAALLPKEMRSELERFAEIYV